MRRRTFITLLGGTCAWPLIARAQQTGKVRRVAFLGTSSPSLEGHLVDAFRQKLRDLGHVEGENIAIEYRWAEGGTIVSRPWQPSWFALSLMSS